jgi:hypothetical protein
LNPRQTRESSRARLAAVPTIAPRISPRLLEAIARFDDRRVPIAETARRVGREAEKLGLPRPSYERVRALVHQLRRARALRGPSTAAVLVDIAFRLRPPEALLDHLSGTGVPDLPRRGR